MTNYVCMWNEIEQKKVFSIVNGVYLDEMKTWLVSSFIILKFLKLKFKICRELVK